MNRVGVPAEIEGSGKSHVRIVQAYLRKAREVGKRRYESSKCTCENGGKREITGTDRASVPAENEESGKPQV